MTTQRFNGTIEKAGSKVLIRLPFHPSDAWGERARYDVTGTVNEHPIRGKLEADGPSFVLPLGPAWRRDTHLEAGAMVDVVLSPEGPQAGFLAEDITAALAAEPQARTFFEGLPTFYRKNYMRWVESAKRPETRAARIEEMVRLLKAGQRQK